MTTSTTTIFTRQFQDAHANEAMISLLSATVLMPSVRVILPIVPVWTSPCLCSTCLCSTTPRGPIRAGQVDNRAHRAPETAPVVHLGSARGCIGVCGARGFCRELNNAFYHEVISHVCKVHAIGGHCCLECLNPDVNCCCWNAVRDATGV
jgi:hypothetical protein